MNPIIYGLLRSVCGIMFILQATAQMQITGKKLFPETHKFFVEHYEEYVHSIPWHLFNINVTASLFREIVAYIIFISGTLLILTDQMKLPSIVMTILGIWSVYVHVLVNDPIFTAVCGGIITAIMLVVSISKPDHEKVE